MKKKCKKSKQNYFDKWDLLLLGLFGLVLYVVYMTPIWELSNPSTNMMFIMRISDKIVGWFFFGIILKKILYKAEQQ